MCKIDYVLGIQKEQIRLHAKVTGMRELLALWSQVQLKSIYNQFKKRGC